MQLTIIPVGHIEADDAALSPELTPGGHRQKIPVYAYLVRTDSSLILFDTGCSMQYQTDPVSLLGADGARELTPAMTPNDYIQARLDQLRVSTEDIDLVINSHWHFDHAGGNGAFPHAEFAVQEAEYQAAQIHHDIYPDPAAQPGPEARLTLWQGDQQIAPGLMVLSTPGHTPGHQSLLVELSSQTVLVTSDAVYTRRHFDPDHLGAAHDPEKARASVLRLIDCARQGARPFFSHDPRQAAEEGWKLAPFTYTS